MRVAVDAVAVDALVEDLWDVGRMDRARAIARRHIEAAIEDGRADALADAERIVLGVAQTVALEVQAQTILAGIRDLRGIRGISGTGGNGGLG